MQQRPEKTNYAINILKVVNLKTYLLICKFNYETNT